MSTTIVAHGLLRPDGMIELLGPVDLPAEPKEVTVMVSERSATTDARPQRREREPSRTWLESGEMISAPFDLPREGTPRIVTPVPGGERLPDPVFILVEDVPE